MLKVCKSSDWKILLIFYGKENHYDHQRLSKSRPLIPAHEPDGIFGITQFGVSAIEELSAGVRCRVEIERKKDKGKKKETVGYLSSLFCVPSMGAI